MTPLPNGNLRLRLLAVAGVLATTAALTWLLRDVVRDVIVLPLTFLLWYLDLLVRSVPERALLIALVILAAILAARSLAYRPPAAPPTGAPSEPRRGDDSRLRFWRVQFAYAPASNFAAEKLAAELRSLLLQTLEHRERLGRDELLRAAADGTLDAPPAVRAILLEQAPTPEHRESLRRRLRRLLRLPVAQEPPTTYERDLTQIVEFLERAENAENP
jgi:hypothetical protein